MNKIQLVRPQHILDLHMASDYNDAKASSVRDYLKALLTRLWIEGEGFSGKRPFGNSGWELEIYAALVQGSVVKGSFDEDGCLEDYDEPAANKLLLNAIKVL